MVETRLRGNHIKAGMTVSATFFSGTLAINCTLLLDAKKNTTYVSKFGSLYLINHFLFIKQLNYVVLGII